MQSPGKDDFFIKKQNNNNKNQTKLTNQQK